MELISPIKQVELDRIAVLDSFFPIEINLSNDLRQLIIDFLFPRIVYEKDGYWVRLGVNLIAGKYCYEIRIYDYEKYEILSTFDITKRTFALGHFHGFKNYAFEFPTNIYWTNKLQNSFVKYFVRYYFCPIDGETYKLEVVERTDGNFYILVVQCPRKEGTYAFAETNKKLIAVSNKEEWNQKTDEYRRMIENYGSDWSKYPVIETNNDINNFIISYEYRQYWFSETDEFDKN